MGERNGSLCDAARGGVDVVPDVGAHLWADWLDPRVTWILGTFRPVGEWDGSVCDAALVTGVVDAPDEDRDGLRVHRFRVGGRDSRAPAGGHGSARAMCGRAEPGVRAAG
ncbi:hypothetical protein IFM12275_53330 [Nocardia sputorum]|uniref:hypothetical protein n=1 Tax=Nocardia sputorum TaxID=2984338 RepID=UPI0024922F62|nr:hypothetical protein [Nocardia sputorum]BDT95357.1 hypothetical protein IFM12275_53330 [Nocardia sputorum]